ncbi:MAG: hypothetical protein ACJ8CR_14300 [Roseiflexaceae bacterium]
MLSTTTIPTLEDFLAAPLADIAAVAPPTVAISVNDARSNAALDGITPRIDEFAAWPQPSLPAYIDLLFTNGVRHVFAAASISPNMADQGLASPEMLEDYARRGWRVRVLGAEGIPELQPIAEAFVRATPPNWSRTLWWTMTPTPEAPWDALFDTIARTGARTPADAIRALYGEVIPPAGMFLSFGKPLIIYDLVPPLLVGNVQSYWLQRPGHRLDERMLRTIIYDYAYLRPTGQQIDEKYLDVTAHRAVWETNAALGMGQRRGSFWYPMLN